VIDLDTVPRRASISLTPLIDVVFILLLFFMLATRFDVWQSDSVSATAVEASEVVDDESQKITVVVAADSSLSIDGEALSQVQLRQELEQLKVESDEALIVLSADVNTSVQQLYDVVQVVKASGLHRLQLTSLEDI